VIRDINGIGGTSARNNIVCLNCQIIYQIISGFKQILLRTKLQTQSVLKERDSTYQLRIRPSSNKNYDL